MDEKKKKVRPNYMLLTRDHFTCREAHNLRVKESKNILFASGKQSGRSYISIRQKTLQVHPGI
jgi:hypothetical protein